MCEHWIQWVLVHFPSGWPQNEDFRLYEPCSTTSVSKAKATRWEPASRSRLTGTYHVTLSRRLVAFVCARFLQADDLRLLMQKMENWAHRLYPKLQFEDFVDKVERLGNKKEVQVGRRHHGLSFHSNDLLTITQFIIIRSHFMFPFVSCRPVSSVFDWTCRWPTKTSWGVREENVFLISMRPMSKSSTSYLLNSATWGGCILKTC